MPLPRTTPANVAVDPRAIADTLTTLRETGQEVHSIMVLLHGQVIAEGWAAPWSAHLPQLVYSVSKTFTSAAVGLVMDDGLLDPDDLLVDIFPDLVDDRVRPKARQIRLRHVLAMASGHTEDMISLVDGVRPDLRRDTVGEFLRHEPEGTPGETFCYNQMCTYSAAQAVLERTGKTVHDVLRERLFPALGITTSTWSTESEGHPYGLSGLHITTEAIASFVQVLLDDGVRDGRQVLPTDWIENHRRTWVQTDPGATADWRLGYGWQVWQSQHGYRVDGAFGQLGLILPEQDMVVVLTTASPDMQTTLDAVWNHLLPGVDRPGDADGQRHLDDVLAGLAQPLPTGASGGDWSGTTSTGGELTLTAQGTGWQAHWREKDLDHTFDVGHGEWLTSTLRLDDGRTLEVAAAAARTEAGHRLELAFPQTPHRGWFDMGEADATTSFEWFQQPLQGRWPADLAHHF